MKSLIYGYGKTGKSFERYLKRKNKDFDIFDSNINKYNKKPDFTNYDEIFCSPGIPQTTFKQLHKKNNNIFTAVSYTHLTLPTRLSV